MTTIGNKKMSETFRPNDKKMSELFICNSKKQANLNRFLSPRKVPGKLSVNNGKIIANSMRIRQCPQSESLSSTFTVNQHSCPMAEAMAASMLKYSHSANRPTKRMPCGRSSRLTAATTSRVSWR